MSEKEEIKHADGICHDWGPDHYYCCLRQAARLQGHLIAANNRICELQHQLAAAQDNVRCLEQQVYGGPTK